MRSLLKLGEICGALPMLLDKCCPLGEAGAQPCDRLKHARPFGVKELRDVVGDFSRHDGDALVWDDRAE